MTGVMVWWRERLDARVPLSATFMIEGYNYKAREGANQDPWPVRVARQALYLDYQSWYIKTILPQYNTPYYRDHPEKIPLYASELVFFSTMTPYLYIYDKETQVKNYHVKESRKFEGKWVTVKVRRYFIKLGSFQEHLEAFKRETGQTLPREA